MKIGILTYYRVPNFGANLQAVSTYQYLKKTGHDVVFLFYRSKRTKYVQSKTLQVFPLSKTHYEFIDKNIPCQTEEFHNAKEALTVIRRNKIDAVIIGSDAVTQHHPMFSTLRWGQSLKTWLRPFEPERRFPNPFWGVGFSDVIPTAMMSVSSQNSPYKKFSAFTRSRMKECLRKIRYISVRDSWTRDMMTYISSEIQPKITPDPVFAFNQNAGQLVPPREEILNRFNLPEKYVLLGLRKMVLAKEEILKLKRNFAEKGIVLVGFPIERPMNLPLEYNISLPLSPIDWYALLKYAVGYIGSNMHPIVVSLHNGNACFSLDNWGTTNFFGKKVHDGSSKVLDIMKRFGVEGNRIELNDDTIVSADEIFSKMLSFPKDSVRKKAVEMYDFYAGMMEQIIKRISV
jgi:hypothetical protein